MILHAGAEDPRLDPFRRVGDPAWLAREGLFVAEGRLVLERLLASRRYDVASIVVTPAAHDALGRALAGATCDVFVCELAALRTITGFNFHRGCLALARRPPAQTLDALKGARRLIAMEGIGNPDNVGGIFRTAHALGAGGGVLDEGCADPLYRKAIRTSMAATLLLPWTRAKSLPDALSELRRDGYLIAALTPAVPSATLAEFAEQARDADRLVLLVGAEGAGLSDAALEIADVRVRIPVDPAVDSLNVVVAAGIALERLR